MCSLKVIEKKPPVYFMKILSSFRLQSPGWVAENKHRPQKGRGRGRLGWDWQMFPLDVKQTTSEEHRIARELLSALCNNLWGKESKKEDVCALTPVNF